MPSPFPGMDPYLESRWRDVHASLMIYARDLLNEQLPSDLQALVEESLDGEVDDQHFRTVYADVRVVEDAWPQHADNGTSAAGGVAVAEPHVVEIVDGYPEQAEKLRHIEIVDNSDGARLVTAIEVLSPANKIGTAGRAAYRLKRGEYLASGVNLVEIDLIRQGEFVLAVPIADVPNHMQPPYLFCVRRARFPSRAELFHASLREPLPNLPVPLRPCDLDVVLQLQPLIEQCYRGGRHDKTDYSKEPTPRFEPDDEKWADQLLRESGRR